MTITLTFGKFKNKTLDEIFDEHPSYIVYLMSVNAKKYVSDEMCVYIKDNFQEKLRVPFGKYKNKLFVDIQRDDPRYFEWFTTNIEGYQWL